MFIVIIVTDIFTNFIYTTNRHDCITNCFIVNLSIRVIHSFINSVLNYISISNLFPSLFYFFLSLVNKLLHPRFNLCRKRFIKQHISYLYHPTTLQITIILISYHALEFFSL